jgi:transcriptional regulator with XRE-family HTH domain
MQLHTYIGKAINAKRIEKNQTLRGLSSRAYISYGYLSEVERGLKSPSSDIINNICNGLKITLLDLMIEVVIAMQEDSNITLDLDKELLSEFVTADNLLKIGR